MPFPSAAPVEPEAASPDLDEKLLRMQALLRDNGSVLVALSGGVDSTLCQHIAHEALGFENAICVTAKSETLTTDEFNAICSLAQRRGWNHRVIEYSELEIPNYAANPVNRCYFCKHELYTRLRVLATELGARCIVEGTNADDLSDYRPGRQAAHEIGTLAPLLECGLGKSDIRALAHRFDLPNWAKPSGACLSSRFPYGEQITREGLNRVAAAESYLQSLGFRQVRVRHHAKLARIEVPATDIPALVDPQRAQAIHAKLRDLGFVHVAVDILGYRTGSMNEGLTGTTT